MNEQEPTEEQPSEVAEYNATEYDWFDFVDCLYTLSGDKE